MPRVVLDVNVLVSAAMRAASLPGRVVLSWREGLFELIVSPRLRAELHDVLTRTHLSRYIDSTDALELLEAIDKHAIVVDDPPLAERLVPGDPDDDYLVALARAGRAQVIVSGDFDLLEADVTPPALSPRAFLVWLERLPL